jgi:asparagine synthase (glutamine-hydrolysing)
MCGIAGVVGRNERRDPGRATERMIDVLAHRGPDDAGVWTEGSVGLGSRRLAVLDLTAAGHQPMTSADDRFVLVFNGEIYNYLEPRGELGGEFHTGTDTEVLLRALTRWGHAALSRLNGMFALALWDRRDETLLLARDRFGVKPLYYASDGDALVFASEVKALAAAGIDIESDLDTWRDYLVTGRYDHDDATFFEGIRRVPPGHSLCWEQGHQTLRLWYDLGAAVGDAGP